MGGRIIRNGRVKFTIGQSDIGKVNMTKKRFLKQAMSFGVQRNEAKLWAAHVPEYGAYKRLWHMCKLPLIWRENVCCVKWGDFDEQLP